MMKKTLAILLFAAFTSPLFSQIKECHSLEEVAFEVNSESLTLFEVDDILIEHQEYASKFSYFEHLKDQLIKEGYATDQIINKVYPVWTEIQLKATPMAISAEKLEAIGHIINKSMHTYGLTHRGERLAFKTIEYLQDQGVYFSSNLAPHHYFSDDLAIFYEGVLFVHPAAHKSGYIHYILENLDKRPEKIVCIDRSLSQLIHLQTEFENLDIDFVGLYYNPQESEMTPLEVEVANFQVEQMHEILSNDLAEVLADQKGISSYLPQE